MMQNNIYRCLLIATLRTTITFDIELHKKVEEMASKSRRSFNNQVLYLIEEGILREQSKVVES